ncbi:biotin synthase BioB [Geobacter sulfurreducens]|uniref:biotin synthase BioB n=1 Tax=Geobacter sulfurreducens TaxID=35554 RepID=UPI000DBAEE81|nr:biotin synthase BioB [Geobacter sulfurreducens]BBA70085.1 Biotin synthase [Geobacter sulfurreducens]
MINYPESLANRIIEGSALDKDQAHELLLLEGTGANALFLAASRVRDHFLGTGVDLCSIINAKSGRCPENCAFCAQSAHHATNAPVYPLVDEEQITACAREAAEAGSHCFGIVTSGSTISRGEELDRICRALRRIRRETAIEPSCSLGVIDYETALALREAGAVTYHHNLETARSFFPNVCTTHDYEEDVETVRVAKRAGLKVCCGGIFGLGETPEQRVEMALTLRELDVDSIPLNFLNPIEGTPLAGADRITPLECLKTIAVYRLILPDRKIAVCGGRERNLRDLQSWMFFAGASGTMIGNYLTTTGRPPEQDWQMLADLGLTVRQCNG